MLLGFFISHGQQVITKFYDKEGRIAEETVSYYYVVKNEPFNSSGDTIRSYYKNGDIVRSVEAVDEAGMREGESCFYHENGNLRTKATYQRGSIMGEVLSYYPDKKMQSMEVHSELNKYRLLNYWDSLGNQIIKDGSGFCRCVFNIIAGQEKLEIGKLQDSLRDSVWVGIRKNGRKYYEEIYDRGKFISGISFDDEEKKYEYNKIEEMGAPEGGLEQAYAHIRTQMRYPAKARKAGIEGKVYVEFIIEKDGSISNVKIVKGIGAGCDEVAINAVKTLPPWIPARQRGQLVRQKMVLPLAFKLN